MPNEYLHALGNNTWYKNIINISQCTETPENILKNLNDYIGAYNLKLIFIIEDIDRGRSKANELIQEILPGLLDRLKDCDNIQFILNIDAEYADPSWLYRISTQIQNMPEIESKYIWRVLKIFRYLMLKINNKDIELFGSNEYKKRIC